ncbi:hypothetical protein HMPREF9719_00149, partial [Corynebacterium otitidis ATCC 51513]
MTLGAKTQPAGPSSGAAGSNAPAARPRGGR